MPPTTPPPPSPSSLRTPPAPLHGPKFDNYEPWAPRKSARSSVQRNQYRARTPPPRQDANELESNLSTPPKGRRAARNRAMSNNLSPPPSAQSSPQKRAMGAPRAAGEHSMSGALGDYSNTSAAMSLGISADCSGATIGKTTSTESPFDHGMLPTPAKTPKKRRAQPVAGLSSTARVLFPPRPQTIEEAMPSPKKSKKGKKYTGFTLTSFSEDPNDDEEGKIEIYTDSKERVPELDTGDDNPFIDRPGQLSAAEEARSPRRRRKANTDGSHEVEKSLERGDGMYYVFRGKKVYRKFDEPNPEDGANPGSPSLSRSSIKPRLLFPSKEQAQARETRNQEETADEDHVIGENEVDEEAATDIDEKRITKSQKILETEDSEMTDVLDIETETEVETEPATPERKTNINPFSSPPSSGTRSMTRGGARKAKPSPRIDGGSPIGRQSVHMTRSKGSAFDSWKRTKGGLSSGRVRKREDETVRESVSKRTRAAGGV
ncbi:MAG: hypothetical protein M1840_001901 [Geoglossum simile]|nr:MAG: hypothetical protein M1840_001901 [Geoglossum simile]